MAGRKNLERKMNLQLITLEISYYQYVVLLVQTFYLMSLDRLFL